MMMHSHSSDISCSAPRSSLKSSSLLKQGVFILSEQYRIAEDVWQMHLTGDCTAITHPGQFVNVQVPGFFLRRPISVANVDGDHLTLIYKTVGEGTRALARLTRGSELDILTGLGNGYSLPDAARRAALPVLLVGGGVGVPPLYWLARELRARGLAVRVVLGFNSRADVFYEKEFAALGCDVCLTTADGSYGTAGFVTACMPQQHEYSYFYACGPIPMLRAVAAASGDTPGELSFEERMGCGFGACMGCSHWVKPLVKSAAYGAISYKRICVEGPVLRKEEIVWE